MSNLTRNSAIYAGAAAIAAAVPFVALPMLARWLGPADFGRVGTYLALVNLAAVVVGLSAHGVISVVHFRQGPERVPFQVGACLRVLLITAVPLGLVLLAGAEPLRDATGIPPAWSVTIPIAAAGQFVAAVGMAVFQTREQALRYGAIQIGLALGWGVPALLLVGGFGLGWEGRAAAQMFAAVAMAVVALHLLHRARLLRWSADSDALRTALRFGVPLLPHSLAGALMVSADRLLLSGLAGPAAAGQYFAAFQIAAVLSVGAAAINQAWVPWLYRRLAGNEGDERRNAVRVTYRIYAGLLVAAAVLVAGAPELVRWIAGERYAEAATLLRWLAPAAALSGMYYFITNYLFYANRTGVLSAITISCSAMQLLLTLALVPRAGAEGAAMAAFATALTYWAATWYAAHRAVPMPWRLRQQGGVA